MARFPFHPNCPAWEMCIWCVPRAGRCPGILGPCPTGSTPAPCITFICCSDFRGATGLRPGVVSFGGPCLPAGAMGWDASARSAPGVGGAHTCPVPTGECLSLQLRLPWGSLGLGVPVTGWTEPPCPHGTARWGSGHPWELRSDSRGPLTAGPRPPRRSCAAPR